MTALEAEAYPYRPLITLLILLGQRRSEIAEMRWGEVNLDARTWTLPKERSKNKAEHTLPLPDDIVEILRDLPRAEIKPRPSRSDGDPRRAGFNLIKERLDKAMLARARGAGQALDVPRSAQNTHRRGGGLARDPAAHRCETFWATRAARFVGIASVLAATRVSRTSNWARSRPGRLRSRRSRAAWRCLRTSSILPR